MSRRERCDRQRGGFTLVELLVVIGIVSVLIAVLLPALISARRGSNAAACLSNLRQWGLAAQMYADANHGYLPRRGQGVQATQKVTRDQDWFNALPPVMGLAPYAQVVAAGTLPRPGDSGGIGRSVWICREAIDPGETYFWSYGMNMALSVEQANQNNGMPDKITGVGNTAMMVFLTDGPPDYCAAFPSIYAGGYNPVARHRGAVNVAFLDGHAAGIDGSYLGVGIGMTARPDIRWQPPNSTWTFPQ